MTTLQKTLIIAAIAATAAVGVYEVRRASDLQNQVQLLQQERASLLDQVRQVESDNETFSNKLVRADRSSAANTERLRELLRLRGEVASLRRQQRQLEQAAALA